MPVIALIQLSKSSIRQVMHISLEMKKILKKIKLILYSTELHFANKDQQWNVMKLKVLTVSTLKEEINSLHPMDLNLMKEIITGSFVMNTSV